MSMIRVENLTFSYPSSFDEIFSKVSFTIDSDWRLGFVGRNGRGKTTFMKLLLGEYEYTGNIISNVQFDYFPFEVKDKTQITEEIMGTICPQAQEWEFIKELQCLNVVSDALWRPFDSLSNGEQTKVLLAALFLKPESFLLIDEPTNHLDIKARKAIAEYLKKKKGFLLASHDRYLLDECVNHVLSINRSTIEVQSGSFSLWFESFEKHQANEISKNNQIKKEISSMRESARQASSWSAIGEKSKNGTRNGGLKVDRGYVGHKAAKMMKRAKNIEARKEKKLEDKSKLLKNLEVAEPLKILAQDYHKKVFASYFDVSILYDKKKICESVSFEINAGDRIFINGENGSGKSSLLKLLLDYNIDYIGSVNKGSNLLISYVPQDTSFLEGNLREFITNNNLNESLFKSILRKLGFERTQFDKNMRHFSAGQKKKVLLAKSLSEPAHLYIWDEPLNYIDIYSRKQLEELILEYSPTMLLVEHDITFVKNIATKIIHL